MGYLNPNSKVPEKEYLVGLNPGPAAGHVAKDYEDFSVFTAEQPKSVWERHTHDCTQITVAMSPAQVRGEWTGAGGAKQYRDLSGDMVWIVPPGVSHVIQFNRRAKLVHLYLSNSFFDTSIQGVSGKSAESLIPALLVRDPTLLHLAKSLYREGQLGQLNLLYTQSVATITATHLLREYSSNQFSQKLLRGGLGPARERRLVSYIQEHLSESLSLSVLAQVAQMSPNYLLTLFHQSLGTTPHQYVIEQRLERACSLIREKNLSLLDVALQCGFQDQSQFTTNFRKHRGITPGEYRRQS